MYFGKRLEAAWQGIDHDPDRSHGQFLLRQPIKYRKVKMLNNIKDDERREDLDEHVDRYIFHAQPSNKNFQSNNKDGKNGTTSQAANGYN